MYRFVKVKKESENLVLNHTLSVIDTMPIFTSKHTSFISGNYKRKLRNIRTIPQH